MAQQMVSGMPAGISDEFTRWVVEGLGPCVREECGDRTLEQLILACRSGTIDEFSAAIILRSYSFETVGYRQDGCLHFCDERTAGVLARLVLDTGALRLSSDDEGAQRPAGPIKIMRA